jgi:hypothetical protein
MEPDHGNTLGHLEGHEADITIHPALGTLEALGNLTLFVIPKGAFSLASNPSTPEELLQSLKTWYRFNGLDLNAITFYPVAFARKSLFSGTRTSMGVLADATSKTEKPFFELSLFISAKSTSLQAGHIQIACMANLDRRAQFEPECRRLLSLVRLEDSSNR